MSEIKPCPFYPEDFLKILAQKDNVTLLANKIFSFMKKCTISGNFTTENTNVLILSILLKLYSKKFKFTMMKIK